MDNAELISERFYKRWTDIYIKTGRKDGWAKAKEWAGRTLPPPVIMKLKPYIEKALGTRK